MYFSLLDQGVLQEMAKLTTIGSSGNSQNEQPPTGKPQVTALQPVTSAKPTNKGLSTVLTVFVSVALGALLVSGCGVAGYLFFERHVKPGTKLEGISITGYTEKQVRDIATTLASNYQMTLEFKGSQATATADDLGITFDIDATINQAMAAGAETEWSIRYDPKQAKDVPLVMVVDQTTLQSYLDSTFVTSQYRSVPASATYDTDKKDFALIPGIVGLAADAATLSVMLAQGVNQTMLDVPIIDEEPSISDAAAQQAIDQATLKLKNKYTIKTVDASYTIPVSSLAKWTTFIPDTENGIIATSYDTTKVETDLPKALAKKLTTATVSKQILIGPNNLPMVVQREGHSGTKIKDPAAAVTSVTEALLAGESLNLKVEVVTDKYKTENVPMADKYLKPHGARWVEVNRSKYTATRWEGTTKLATYSVVVGYASTPTPVGVFAVWLKVASQTMKGDDYEIPNVTWVSYFEGGNALHTNYWLTQFGRPGSHGCVGMPAAHAKAIYDWIKIGDMVIVHD